MATIISRRALPRHRRPTGSRAYARETDESFFQGAAFALPLGLLLWLMLIWTTQLVI